MPARRARRIRWRSCAPLMPPSLSSMSAGSRRTDDPVRQYHVRPQRNGGLAGRGGLSVSVTAAEGFVAAGVHAGLKPSRRDMALLATVDGKPVPTAAVFTTNKFRAPPVEACVDRLKASN